MSRFIVIAGIRLEHDYYIPPINSHLGLKPTSQTDELMKRRGVYFRKITPNEWQWFGEEDHAGFMEDDVLEVSITTDDPEFIRKISLKKGYDLLQLYQICLGRERVVEFNPLPVPDKAKRQGEFCRVVLKPILPIYTIKFSTCSYYWEYLFVFKGETDQDKKNKRSFVLETNAPKNEVVFHASEKYEDSMLGNVYRIISEVKIEARERFGFTLILYENLSEDNKRRVISKFIPIPQLGKYIASRPDILKEVCYL